MGHDWQALKGTDVDSKISLLCLIMSLMILPVNMHCTMLSTSRKMQDNFRQDEKSSVLHQAVH